MNFKCCYLMMAVFPFLIGSSTAQTDADLVVESIIESIADRVTDDFDFALLTERLYFYQKHPFNINKANQSDLSQLFFLSPLQINSILNHVKQNGEILDLAELQTLNGFDLETIRKLLPFISTGKYNSLKNTGFSGLSKDGKHDVMLRYGKIIQPQIGYQPADSLGSRHYLGPAFRMMIRYRYNYGQNVSAAINLDKDAGELLGKHQKFPRFDFYSGNIFLKNAGSFSKIAIGDYSLQFGQGLSLWSGQGIGKGAEIGGTAKQDMGLRPYSSSNEALFFRGAATTIKVGSYLYTPFLSINRIDANLSLSALNTLEIGSVSTSGLHRTYSEMENKNSAEQLVFGNALQYDGKNFDMGITAYHIKFNRPFQKGKLLYNQFDFASSSLTNFGMHYSYTYRNSYFFGEIAHSLGSGLAFLNGLITSLNPRVSAVFLYRRYDRDYYSFYNQAFSEGSTAANERGFYSGLVIKPAAKLELASYMDIFSFPWMKFRADAPSKGCEYSSQAVYTFDKKLRLTARYRYQLKEENDVLNETVNNLVNVKRQNFRMELYYKLGQNFTLRNRAEISSYKEGTAASEQGYLLYQDLIFNPLQSRLSGNLRMAIFDTPGFDTRIYAYENDVLYSYSSPAYQNSGLRYYINGRISLKKGLDLWLKYSITDYANLEEIGSGYDLIRGNKKSEVKLQLRYQF